MKPSAWLLCLFVAACGSGDGKVCEPGDTENCTCDGGEPGTRNCNMEGTGFLPCECPCVPDCFGRQCGPDPRCGESCGDCPAGRTCNELFQCIDDTCPPDCTGRVCGPDPVCGLSCGTCPGTQTCTDAGQCVCQPDCSARVCGPDPLCGVSCGDCPTGQACTDQGQCESCTRDCTNRVCGPDPACGESCGDCDAGQMCNLDGQCVTQWIIEPGTGIGPVLVSANLTTPFTLGDTRAALGESGTPVGTTKYTLGFLGDTLRASGIDVNGNQLFDDNDRIISVTALEGLSAVTSEGLAVGSSLAEVHAVGRFASPDRSAVIPPYGEYDGGKVESYFGLGVFVGYDEVDTVGTFIVTRSYPQPPDGVINPAAATLNFGGQVILCGNGYDTGSLREDHRAILGDPDWLSSFEASVETQGGTVIDVQFYVDSYRILGMEFIGGDDSYLWYDIDKLVAVTLYPFFYGATASGHGLGSTKAEWETELGAPFDTRQDPAYDGVLYLYQPSAEHVFAVIYTNGGASPDDQAVFLVLNYQEG